ncbi:MAG: hypothetical protein HYZ27_06680 [Deltaproteobacteria bacterium]|nr:hypothetical protein [Deltaproteobacteria bacterium]
MMYKEAISKLVTDVLDGTELELKADTYTLEENFEAGAARLRCEVHDARTGARQVIEGQGVGLVDALWNGVVSRYSSEFPSLKSIRIVDFAIKANVDTGRQASRTDMAAMVTLRIANTSGKEFAFSHSSPSITRSSVAAVLDAVEFFVNSESAYIALYKALQHARAQNRVDSVARYTSQLATLVEATSYSEVIEQIRKGELDKK